MIVMKNKESPIFDAIINYKKLTHKIPLNTSFIAIILIISFLSGCGTAFVASKQDDLLTQIDVWSAENEYGKAFNTMTYVKESHPQYKALQIRKKSLVIQANEYEQSIDKQIKSFIKANQWAEALDLIDQAKEKYPLGDSKNRDLIKTEKNLLSEQQQLLTSINQKLMIKRSQWMIETLPVYHEKLKTDPRNESLQHQINSLDKEAKQLSQELTLLARQAIDKKHYKTAKIRIKQAITLESNKEREDIAAQLKGRSRQYYKKKKIKKQKSQEKTRKEQQTILLQEIEKSYNTGDFLRTRQLISRLDENGQNDIQLIQIKQELNRSINYTVKKLMSKANKNYTDGEFQDAINLWQQVLMFEPDNLIAKKNIRRSEKVIEKLSSLREKQSN